MNLLRSLWHQYAPLPWRRFVATAWKVAVVVAFAVAWFVLGWFVARWPTGGE